MFSNNDQSRLDAKIQPIFPIQLGFFWPLPRFLSRYGPQRLVKQAQASLSRRQKHLVLQHSALNSRVGCHNILWLSNLVTSRPERLGYWRNSAHFCTILDWDIPIDILWLIIIFPFETGVSTGPAPTFPGTRHWVAVQTPNRATMKAWWHTDRSESGDRSIQGQFGLCFHPQLWI